MLSTAFLYLSLLAPAHLNAPQAAIYEQGIYAWSRENSSVIISKNTTNPLRFEGGHVAEVLATGSRVPLIRGLSFGFFYDFPTLNGDYKMLWQVEHPPITTPDGRVSTGYQEERNVYVSPGIPDIRVYTFDHPYEMVEGRWVFRYFYQGQQVLEQSFTTYKPDAAEAKVWQQKLNKALNEQQP